jgi:N-acetyl-beta-hexosaminidase
MDINDIAEQVDDLVEFDEDDAMNLAHEAMTVIERYVDDGHRRREDHEPLAFVTLADADLPGVDSDGCPLVAFERNGRRFEMKIVVMEVE